MAKNNFQNVKLLGIWKVQFLHISYYFRKNNF